MQIDHSNIFGLLLPYRAPIEHVSQMPFCALLAERPAGVMESLDRTSGGQRDAMEHRRALHALRRHPLAGEHALKTHKNTGRHLLWHRAAPITTLDTSIL